MERLIRRVQIDQPLTAEVRSAVFADLSRRLIQVRGLMASAAMEMNVTSALMESIQHHHRAIVASLEMISSVRLNAPREVQLALSRIPRRSGKAMRLGLLSIARALRAGDTSGLQADAALARPPTTVSDGSAGGLAGEAPPNSGRHLMRWGKMGKLWSRRRRCKARIGSCGRQPSRSTN